MKILVVGGGGREHALAWKMAQSPEVDQVYVAPGNAGTAMEEKTQNAAIRAEDVSSLFRFAKDNRIDLTVVGPEAPLIEGIVDTFLDAGLRIFGPPRNAAQLEGSKAFSKAFMHRHNIPTARYGVFTDMAEAMDFIHDHGAPIVVKADGLAAGKGVIVARTVPQAVAAARGMLVDGTFGAAGRQIVIEELLVGEEGSFICMVDGEHVLPLATSQDHKARDNGDNGPNTGGMGAYSPAPVFTEETQQRVLQEVILPTVRGMATDGNPYTGFLYAGLMIGTDGKPRVLEYNCRFGDPEAQPILMRLRTELPGLITAALQGKLHTMQVAWDERPALGVVLAAEGYPDKYERGRPISGLRHETSPDVKIFHAGTASEEGNILTNGGRVLCVTALGESVEECQKNAYRVAEGITWDGMHYRTDIGHKAVDREHAA
jgi:phosphoribosylamine--glycine ligase